MSGLLLAQSRPAMPANVIKSPNLPVLVPSNDQRFAGNFRNKKIARLRDLALMPHQHPLPRKNLLLFRLKDFPRNKIFLRQRRRARGEVLWRLAKGGNDF